MEKPTGFEQDQAMAAQLDDRFLQLCVGEKMSPEKAAEKMGIPYELWVHRRDLLKDGKKVHPHLEVAWRFCKPDQVTTLRRKLPRGGLEIKERFRERLMVRSGFFEKIADWLGRVDPNDPDPDKAKEGQEVYMQFIKNGLIRDLLPKESATITENVDGRDESESMTLDELLEAVRREGQEVEVLLAQRETAVKVMASSTEKVREARGTIVGRDGESTSP